MLSTSSNSFVQFGMQPQDPCIDNVSLCLPISSISDINFQVPVVTTGTMGSSGDYTLSILKNQGNSATQVGSGHAVAINWVQIQAATADQNNCWICVTINNNATIQQLLPLLMNRLNHSAGQPGTWYLDSGHPGSLDCTGDISNYTPDI